MQDNIDLFSYLLGKSSSGGGGDVEVKPLTVTANGVYDDPGNVAYKPVRVQVPTPTLEDVTITENGTTEAIEGKAFKKVTVEVPTYPEPTGSIEITENGTYNVKDKAEAVVDVQGGVNGIIFNEVDENGYPTSVTIPSNTPQTHNLFYIKSVNWGLYGKLKELDYNHCSAEIGQQFAAKCGSLSTIKNIENVKVIYDSAFTDCPLDIDTLPPYVEEIREYAFRHNNGHNKITEIPSSVKKLGAALFQGSNVAFMKFKGKPTTINVYAFQYMNNLVDIYVPWAEGEVANAPWSATNATITYNYTGE